MNNLEIFKNEEFGEVRATEIDNEPWFVGRDVCEILDVKNVPDAMGRLDEDEKLMSVLPIAGQNREVTLINESGLYSLILRSRKPEAKRFKKWVTSEVLPSIRKTGGYSLQIPKTYAEALRLAADQSEQIEGLKHEKKQLQVKAIRDQPKVEFYDQVINSDGAMSMNDTAKVLGIPNFGRTKLFEYLRKRKILDGNNVPYQRFVDHGWFNVTESKYETEWGTNITRTTRVYQRGLDGIRKALKKDGYFKKENK